MNKWHINQDLYVSRTPIVFDRHVKCKALPTERLIFRDLQEQIQNYTV